MIEIKNPDAAPNREWPPNGELSAWIMSQFEPGYVGYAVDVGASDGISVNTTYMLEKSRWTVLCIEPNPIFWPKLKAYRAFVETCACDVERRDSAPFHVFEHNPEAYSALRPTYPQDFPPELGWTTIQVPVRTLNHCLERWAFPRLDALCVDTEGNDLEVLKGLDWSRFKPKVVVIEAWEKGKHDAYLGKLGYQRVGRSADNDLFIKK